MRILLTESGPGVGDDVHDALHAAGHQVRRCSPRGTPGFPCQGLAGGPCPVDEGVDVVVAVRDDGDEGATATETGVTCALRRHVPLVVAGGAGHAPFDAWATARVDATDLAAVEDATHRAAGAEPRAHAEVAAAEAARRGWAPVEARAARQDGGIAVTVTLATPLDAAARETLGVQVAGAVRRFDPWAGVIDVAVHHGG